MADRPIDVAEVGRVDKTGNEESMSVGKKISTATQELKKDSFKKATVNSYKYCREKKEEM